MVATHEVDADRAGLQRVAIAVDASRILVPACAVRGRPASMADVERTGWASQDRADKPLILGSPRPPVAILYVLRWL